MSGSEHYEVVERIGHGAFGLINKVRRKQDGQIFCRKEISYAGLGKQEKQQFIAEYNILSTLRHPNIVAYYHREHLKVTQDVHLYMEYCGNGDLGKVIRDLKATNRYAEEDFVWSIFAQLVTALYRCHYGVDPPQVGKNITVTGNDIRPGLATKEAHDMILHRDLKPDNVFLGEDNAVKLGDFGLSKLIKSHDLASTYVGTPFYMSPEICASERYTLHSDIWSLGCVMWELCAREPPFNARNHFTLVQKIQGGRLGSLPPVYSPQLQQTIRSCLQVNPKCRPDTAQLLNMPVIRLMRKEREVVELGRVLRSKDEMATLRLKQIEEKERTLQAEIEKRRVELDASLRREWEVKAQLAIDQRTQENIQMLQKQFETEVQQAVQIEVQKHLMSLRAHEDVPSRPSTGVPVPSLTADDETDFPSTTDFSALSLESPSERRTKPPMKGTRTPFGRSQTMFVGSPMDVQMVDPSPIALDSLSLSPRRNKPMASRARNIFTDAEATTESESAGVADHSEDEDAWGNIPLPPSPTLRPTVQQGHKVQRPRLQTQKTAPVLNRNMQLDGFRNIASKVPGHGLATVEDEPYRPRRHVVDGRLIQDSLKKAVMERRVSRVSGATGLFANESGSPVRKTASRPSGAGHTASSNPQVGGEQMFKAVTKNNMMKGRTLIELAQARTGGAGKKSGSGPGASQPDNRGNPQEEDVVWDPERDEMPSPFLVRGKKVLRQT
ncbi:MAG: G2-specific serine/threonine protein kinase [Watsoniomyces obsoletus]|nr:MAG: G2-specific serine/threonine protein kinase [Watsoniomyces obsoletus]